MRLVDAYLACYYLLAIAAFATLSQRGILGRFPPGWTVAAAFLVLVLGVLLRVLSRK